MAGLVFTPIDREGEEAPKRLVFTPIDDGEAEARAQSPGVLDRVADVASDIGGFVANLPSYLARGARGTPSAAVEIGDRPAAQPVIQPPSAPLVRPEPKRSFFEADYAGPVGPALSPVRTGPQPDPAGLTPETRSALTEIESSPYIPRPGATVRGIAPQRELPGSTIGPSDFDFARAKRTRELSAVNRGAIRGYEGLVSTGRGLTGAAADLVGANRIATGLQLQEADRQRELEQYMPPTTGLDKAVVDTIASLYQSIPISVAGANAIGARAVQGLLQQGGINVARAAIERSSIPATVMAGIYSAGQQYVDPAMFQASPLERGAYAGIHGAFEFIGERIGLPALAVAVRRASGTLGADQAKRAYISAFAREIGGEEITTLGKIATDLGFEVRPGMTAAQLLEELADTAIVAGAQTALMTGGARIGREVKQRAQLGSVGSAHLNEVRAKIAASREATRMQLEDIGRSIAEAPAPAAPLPTVQAPPREQRPIDPLQVEQNIEYAGGQPQVIAPQQPERGLIEVPGQAEPVSPTDFSGQIAPTVLRTQLEDRRARDRRDQVPDEEATPLRSSYEAALARYPATAPEEVETDPQYEAALADAGVETVDRQPLPIDNTEVVLGDREHRPGTRGIVAFVDQLERRDQGQFFKDHGLSKPDVVKRIVDMERHARTGAASARWYEETIDAWRKMFRGDRQAMDVFAQIIAITSANTEVKANWSIALKALMQYYRGKPINVKSRSDNEKLNAILYDGIPWEGRKTNAFYEEMSRLIWNRKRPKSADTVQDIHMTRALLGSDVPTDREYDFGDEVTKLIAQRQNWSPQQAQAAVWVGKKADSLYQQFDAKRKAAQQSGKWSKYATYTDRQLRAEALERAKTHYGHLADALGMFPLPEDFSVAGVATRRESGAQLFAETRPSTKVPAGMAIAKQSLKRQREFQAAALNAIGGARAFAQAFGLDRTQVRVVPGMGAYQSDGLYVTAPNVILTARVPRATVEAMSRAWAYVFRQDSVPFYRAVPSLKDDTSYPVGIRFVFKEHLKDATLAEFSARVRELVDPSMGFSVVNPNEIEIVNFSSMEDGEFGLRMGDLIAAFRGTIVSAEHFGADGDYLGLDWERAESVEDTRQQISRAGFDGIQGRLEDWQRKVDAVASRFAAGGEATDAERRNPFQERRAPKPARAEPLAGGPRQTDIVFGADTGQRGRLHGEEIRQAQALAERIDGPGEVTYAPLPVEAARSIADAYEKLPRTGGADAKRAYAAFAKEVDRQYDRVAEVITVEPWDREGQPYRNSAEMRADVLDRHHIFVFSGGDQHAFLSRDQNYRFRAIHDIYGHALTGFEFGPRGEFNATRAHAQMFSAEARPAMVAETLGQNSWVNFGPHSHLPVMERPYAEQKAALLPAELYEPLLSDEAVFGMGASELAQTRNAAEIAKYADAAQLWRDLAISEDLFTYPHTRMREVPDIVKAIDPGIKPSVAFEETDENGVTSMQEWRFQMPDGSRAQMTVDGQEVWLDLAGLSPGVSRGSAMYAIASEYAFNTGRTFIGDPAGITPIGKQRRIEHMLSHALKVGSTDHLEPHPSMNLPWERGNDAFNIGSMVRRSYENTLLDAPKIATIVYNSEKDQFETTREKKVTDDQLLALAKRAGSRTASLGVRTLKRAAVVNTVLRESGEATEGPGARLLARTRGVVRGESKLPRGLEGTFYQGGSSLSELQSLTTVSAKTASLPWFKAGDVRRSVANPKIQTVNKHGAATLQAALKDVIDAGMPAHIAQTVDGWGDYSSDTLRFKAAFLPDEGVHAIAVNAMHLDGPNVNYQALRWWLAHELTHHLDNHSAKVIGGKTVTDAISAKSPRMDYVVDSGGDFIPQGDLMQEAWSVYERGDATLWEFMSYPFATIDYSDTDTIKMEVLAQMGALYNQRPELMQRSLPQWHAVMEQVYGTQESAQAQEVPTEPRAAFAATREKLRRALQDEGAVELGERREPGRTADTAGAGEAGRGSATGGAPQPVLGVGGPAQPGSPTGGAQQPGGAGRVRTAVTQGPAAPPPIHQPRPGWAFNPLNQPFVADPPGRWDAVVRTFQDKVIDTSRVQDAIKKIARIEQLPDNIDTILADELYYGRVSARTQDAWKQLFEPLLRQLSRDGLTIDDVDQYLKARHAPERNAQMAKINPNVPNNQALSGMSNQDAAKIIADFRAKGKLPHLLGIARRVDAITDATRRLIVSSGLETQATIDAWTSVYKHYVPLMREEDDPGMNASGFSVTGPESKRAMGSTREAKHILANLFAQHERVIQRSERNKVGIALYSLAKHAPNANFWQTHDPSAGTDALPRKRHIDPRTGFVVTGIDPLYKQAPHVLVMKIAGVEHAVVFNERNDRALLMARNLKNLDSARIGPVLDVVARTTRTMANLATQWNPVFWATNFTRDYQTALANISDTPIANHRARITKNIAPAMRGMYQHLRGNTTGVWAQRAREFQAEGGMTGFSTIFDGIVDREKEIRREVKAGARSAANPLRLGRAFFEWVGAVNNAIENAIRLAAYVEAKNAGMSVQRAASLSKNLTVNFNRKGNATPFIGALYMFFNASVQGNARMIKAVAKSRTVQAAVAAAAMIGFALDVMNRAISGEDEDGNNRWDILPEHLKQRNWVFFTGDGDEFYKIPLPYGYHIFPNAGRLIAAALWDTRPQAEWYEKAASFGSVVADGLSPLGSSPTALQFAAPTVADPFVQWAENKSWTGAPLRREQPRFGREVPEYTLTQRRDSEFAKATAKWLNDATGGDDVAPGTLDFPPALFDHIVRSATLGTGQTISQVADFATKSVLGEEISRNAVPLLNRFMGDVDDTIRSREFWDRYSKAKVLLDQATAYRKQGRDDKAEELIGENRALIDLAKGYKAQSKPLRALNKERQEVELGDAEYADRREAYRDIENRRIEVLRRVMREARQ